MKKEDFLKKITSVLELEDEDIILTMDTNLKDLDDYDSFSILSIIVFIHKNFELQLTARQLQNVGTPHDIVKLIGEDKFE